MGLQDGDVTDSSVAAAERSKVAGLKVERYFDQLIDGKTRLRPLPSALATLLRDRLPYAVHDAGVNRAVELAMEQKDKAAAAGTEGSDAACARRAAGAGPAPRRPVPRPDPAHRRRARRHRAPGHPRRARGRPPRPPARRRSPGTVRDVGSGGAACCSPRWRWSRRLPAQRLAAQDSAGVTAPPATPARGRFSARHPAPTPLGPATAAQPDGPIVVDRVVAVVGNRPVLASQVDEEIFSRQSQGQAPPTIPTPWTRSGSRSSRSIVDEELLVQQAQRDTAIKVTDQEIADGVEQQVRKVRGNFTSEARLQERAQEGRIRHARGVPALAHRPAAAGGVPEPADRQAAAGRQAQAGAAHRAGDAGVLRRAEGQPRQPSGDDLVPADRHRPPTRARGQGAHAGPGRLDRARAPARRRLRHRRQAVLAGSRAPRIRAARSTGSGAA